MEQQTITAIIYVLVVGVILGYIGFNLYLHHLTKYGACWSLILKTIEEMASSHLNQPNVVKQLKQHRCLSDVTQDYISQYVGSTDLDSVFIQYSTDIDFFKGLTKQLDKEWNSNASCPFTDVLRMAIYAYNIDDNYHVSLREFMNHLCFIYKGYYTLPARAQNE